MPLSPCDIALGIKSLAARLGFDACGMADAGPVPSVVARRHQQWVESGMNDCMQWAGNHCDLRDDPRLLVPGAKTVISLAMNYYPQARKAAGLPQFAYYAYGRDYHEVLRGRAQQIAEYIKAETGEGSRVCVDSAPVHERYWAVQAGIGFIGLNGMLIVPGVGSYCLLCEVITTAQLPPSEPCRATCAGCHACEARCPGHALRGGMVDARRCLSCMTIERRGELPDWVGQAIGNRVFGCDECQLCCPHNKGVAPTTIPEFQPKPEFLSLSLQEIERMTQPQFSSLFSHSAVKRAKLAGLQRNAALLKPYCQ